MKKIILFLIMLFITQTLFSQKIILHRNTGEDQTFQLSSVDSVTFLPFTCGDELRYEGKTYPTVLVGDQCWMKKNLDVGVMINGNQEQTNNSPNIIEKYCYENITANCETYGGLYQWYEAMKYDPTLGSQGICPNGWHIPTYDEFNILRNYVGNDGNALKEFGQGTGTNSSGFSLMLAGVRYTSSLFTELGISTWLYSSNGSPTTCRYIYLYADDPNIYSEVNYPTNAMSVRCLKNQ